MPARRNINVKQFRTYARQTPTVKDAVADRLRAIERAAAPGPGAYKSRCCGRCRTPYNCGNAGCSCHSADRVRGMLDN